MTEPELPRIVVPGEYLGAAEEYLPGTGTYEDAGRIYASVVGRPTVDPKDKTVRVQAANAVPDLAEGDLVYARVDELKPAMAICTVLMAANTQRGIPATPEGTVHISKAREGYVETLSDEFAPGDILLARVLQARPGIKLTTAAPPLGVISARCQVCHALLRSDPKGMTCPRCGHSEHRKQAQGVDLYAPFESA